MLVYDLGGGTFDVSIVQAQDGVVEVLASHGDTQLGGDDFDELLLNHVADDFHEKHGIDLRDEPRRAGRGCCGPSRRPRSGSPTTRSPGSRRSSSPRRTACRCT